ncbi:MAG: sigma-70 family RNA polymerase sigma factor, partial [Bacilli bacterium]|nr:sigma-70 family RNA polymerase sigma factor [Bacilli bacterium]
KIAMKITKSLIEKLKQKDEEAFEIVYNEYEKLIYYIAFSITRNKENAEEVVQDTFLRMFNSIDNYTDKGKFKEWLTEIARNISKNKVTRDKEKNTIYDDEIIGSAKSEKSNIDIILTIEGILEPLEADIVILRIVYDFSFKEIAKYENMTIGKIQSLYYSSLKKLKKGFMYE